MVMKESPVKISAAEFKAKCLKLMDEVAKTRKPIVITKRGKPVAKLVPADPEPRKPLFGYMAGTISYVGDIESPLDVEWERELIVLEDEVVRLPDESEEDFRRRLVRRAATVTERGAGPVVAAPPACTASRPNNLSCD